MLVDVHTHNPKGDADVIEVVNLNPTESQKNIPYYSYGIHPWTLNEISNLEKEIQKLESIIQDKKLIALGETGLDRTIDTSMELQKEFFKKHLELASKYDIKVVILHCVKAYSDILQVVKETNYSGNFLFHDYNGNIQETAEFLKRPFFFSFSRALFNPQMKGHQSLQQIPMDRVFVETDDQLEHSISDHYQQLAAVKNLSLQKLEEQIYSNFQKCFYLS